LCFIATLPFAKGKGFQIILLPKEQIIRYALYKISYYFPLYLSDLFLVLLTFIPIRENIGKRISIPKMTKLPLVFFLLFICVVLFTAISSIFFDVVYFSVIQLLRLSIVFISPFFINLRNKKNLSFLYLIIAAGVIFQSTWVFAQVLHKGPLGRDLEVFLPGTEFGIKSSENRELMRATGTFFEPSILGTYILMQITLLGIFFLSKKDSNRHLYIVSIIFGLIALVFTGSRFLYTLALLLVMLFLKKFALKNNYAVNLRLKIFLLLILGIIVLTLPYIVSRISSFTDVFSKYGSGSYRIQMAIYALRLFFERPLFGVGINLSPYFFATGFPQEVFVFDPTYPHNLMMQLLAETGILGTTFFILFIFAIFRTVYERALTFFSNEFMAASLIFIVCAQFYPIFLNHTEILTFLFLFLGLSLSKKHYEANA
jgi:O-antigen ligase